jgi:hypothetical protein
VAFQSKDVLELVYDAFDDLPLSSIPSPVAFSGQARRAFSCGVAATSAPYSSSQYLSHSTDE